MIEIIISKLSSTNIYNTASERETWTTRHQKHTNSLHLKTKQNNPLPGWTGFKTGSGSEELDSKRLRMKRTGFKTGSGWKELDSKPTQDEKDGIQNRLRMRRTGFKTRSGWDGRDSKPAHRSRRKGFVRSCDMGWSQMKHWRHVSGHV